MRNIAALAESPADHPSLTDEERKMHRAGIRSLREYRHENRANRLLPSARPTDEEAA